MNYIKILENIIITPDCYIDGTNCDNCIFHYENNRKRVELGVKTDCRFTAFSEIKKEANVILQRQKLSLL